MIKRVTYKAASYDIAIRHPIGSVEIGERDDTRRCVLEVVTTGTSELRLFQCSIEAEAWHAAGELNPTDDDVLEFYALCLERSMPAVLKNAPGTKWVPFVVTMDHWALWKQFLMTRRAAEQA